MKNEKFNQVYNEFLKSKIDEYCNEERCCEIYWDYRDDLSPAELLDAYKNFSKSGYERIEDYIEEKLLDYNMDYDTYMISQIANDLKSENFYTEEFEKWYEEYCDIYEDLLENGYNGIDVNLRDLLRKSTFYFNIMFATDEEQNYDMGSIVTAFGTYHTPYYEYLEKDNFDNALTYLIHQQGHTCKEYFDVLENNQNGYGMNYKCDFIESIVNDVVNNASEAMSELTVLVKMDGEDALKFINYLEDKENNKNLKFDKNCDIGIFNEWSGCGGLLEFALEKDFIVPKNMIRGFQIEGAREQGYTVDEVYGLIGSCWKECLNYTDEKPELIYENIEDTIKYVKELSNEVELEAAND